MLHYQRMSMQTLGKYNVFLLQNLILLTLRHPKYIFIYKIYLSAYLLCNIRTYY